MKTNDLDHASQLGVSPIKKVLHDVEQALHDIDPPFSHRAPIGIFCFIGMLSVLVLAYRLFAG